MNHYDIRADFIKDSKEKEKKKRKMMELGILYFAKGEGYRREAVKSAKQLKNVMPDIPVVLFTDKATNAECFFEEIIDRTDFSKRDKARALLKSPFEKSIYLDSDIYVEKNIIELFDLLEEFDMGFATDPKDHHLVDDVQHSIPDSFPEFNTGVIVFNKSKNVINMLNVWEEKCKPWHAADQSSFRKAVYESDIQFTLLPRRFNYMYRAPAQVMGQVKVYHGTLQDHRGSDISLHELNIEDAKQINKDQSPRVSFKLEDKLIVNPPQSLANNFIYYLLYTNPRTTSKKILEFVYDRVLSGVEEKLREAIFQIQSPSYIELKIGDITAHFSTKDLNSGSWDYRDDMHSEQQIIKNVLREIEKGDVFYDIGANIGIYSCLVGEIVEDGEVVAFEPHPSNYQSLKNNCDFNNIDADLHEIALGSKDSEMYLEPMGSTGHVVRDEYQAGWEKIRVVNGDQFIENHDIHSPNICKIDVEGAELEVITGLQKTLSQGNCRTIYCEFHPEKLKKGDESVEGLIQNLSDMGYNIEYLQNRSGNFFIKANK